MNSYIIHHAGIAANSADNIVAVITNKNVKKAKGPLTGKPLLSQLRTLTIHHIAHRHHLELQQLSSLLPILRTLSDNDNDRKIFRILVFLLLDNLLYFASTKLKPLKSSSNSSDSSYQTNVNIFYAMVKDLYEIGSKECLNATGIKKLFIFRMCSILYLITTTTAPLPSGQNTNAVTFTSEQEYFHKLFPSLAQDLVNYQTMEKVSSGLVALASGLVGGGTAASMKDILEKKAQFQEIITILKEIQYAIPKEHSDILLKLADYDLPNLSSSTTSFANKKFYYSFFQLVTCAIRKHYHNHISFKIHFCEMIVQFLKMHNGTAHVIFWLQDTLLLNSFLQMVFSLFPIFVVDEKRCKQSGLWNIWWCVWKEVLDLLSNSTGIPLTLDADANTAATISPSTSNLVVATTKVINFITKELGSQLGWIFIEKHKENKLDIITFFAKLLASLLNRLSTDDVRFMTVLRCSEQWGKFLLSR